MEIPCIFHQIWLGGLDMPPKLAAWSTDCARLHPKWELRLWRECGDGQIEANGVKFVSQYPKQLARACHLSQRSNILRYELVSRFGGVYLDTDVELIRPIDPLLVGVEAFASLMTAARNNKTQVCLTCSVFGAVPEHPWTGDLAAQIADVDTSVNGSLGSLYFAKVSEGHPEITRFAPGVLSAPNKNSAGYAIHHWSSRWWPNSFEPLSKSKKSQSTLI
jgi:mannosyltransferase OCH1-like enzyme